MRKPAQRASGLAERLVQARKHLGLSQDELAHKMGVKLRTYARSEAGERALTEGEIQILAELGINLYWLFTGNGAVFDAPGGPVTKLPARQAPRLQPAAPQFDMDHYVLVPRYDIQASAGPGAFTDEEQIVDWLAFSREWVRSTLRVDPKWLVLLSAIGDSMEPTIRAGDLLLVDRSVGTFRDDAIYVIQVAGQLMVKRIQRFFDGAVVVKSDNAMAYVHQTLNKAEAEAVLVAGRVRWIGRMI